MSVLLITYLLSSRPAHKMWTTIPVLNEEIYRVRSYINGRTQFTSHESMCDTKAHTFFLIPHFFSRRFYGLCTSLYILDIRLTHGYFGPFKCSHVVGLAEKSWRFLHPSNLLLEIIFKIMSGYIKIFYFLSF